MRKVLKLVDGKFIDCEMKDLVIGDSFKMFESNGDPVLDKYGEDTFNAASNAYLRRDNIYVVEVEKNYFL